MKDITKLELNKWPEIPVKIVFYLIIYTNREGCIGQFEVREKRRMDMAGSG